MTETYNPLDVQFAFLDVKKDWDIDIKFDYDASYDLKVDIDKTVFEFVYVNADVDVKDNTALITATFENIGTHSVLDGTAAAITTDTTSISQAVAEALTPFNYTSVAGVAQATGYNTYTELDFNAQVYDFGTTVTIIGISATD